MRRQNGDKSLTLLVLLILRNITQYTRFTQNTSDHKDMGRYKKIMPSKTMHIENLLSPVRRDGVI